MDYSQQLNKAMTAEVSQIIYHLHLLLFTQQYYLYVMISDRVTEYVSAGCRDKQLQTAHHAGQ